jgi:hypothetical protein
MLLGRCEVEGCVVGLLERDSFGLDLYIQLTALGPYPQTM